MKNVVLLLGIVNERRVSHTRIATREINTRYGTDKTYQCSACLDQNTLVAGRYFINDSASHLLCDRALI